MHIKLPGGAQLSRRRAGTDNHWVFLPGGPGLGTEYFYPLLDAWKTDANLWTLDYAVSKNSADWLPSILELSKHLEKIVIVGHSYGGMLLLSIDNLEERLGAAVQGWVFLDSSPNLSWQKSWAKQASIQSEALKEPQRCEQVFAKSPSAEGFRAILHAWAPYYFEPTAVAAGRELLSTCHYHAHAYVMAKKLLSHYDARWVPRKKTLVLAGNNDRITPLTCFTEDPRFQKPHIKTCLIPDAGHFPWVENSQDVLRALSRFNP